MPTGKTTEVKALLGFNDRWFMLIGIPIVTFIINSLMFTDFLLHRPPLFWGRCFLIGILYTTIYWSVFRWLLIFYRKKFSTQFKYGKQLVIQIIAVFIIFLIIKSLLDPILHPIVDGYIEVNEAQHNISMTIGGLTVTFLVLGVYETAGFYAQLRKSMVEREQLKKENMRSQLEGLKNQVNPHFFFNSLNTLSYLISEDTDKAENFVQKLSKAYRYILEIRNQELMPLEKELDFLDSYTCLLKERFGENINIEIDVAGRHLQKMVVPLSLQMLFENAIKHNIISSKMPLTIRVRIKDDVELVVENDLQPKNQVIHSTKIGLENIKKRYLLLSEKKVAVGSSEGFFRVTLPLIDQQMKTVET